MQNLQSDPVQPGHQVRVRGARWRVVDVRACEDCQIVTLAGTAPPHAGVQRRVLTPFETIEAVDRPQRPRFVRPLRWRRACRALLSADTPPGALRSAARARITLMPYQLEPALAVLRGLGSRLLLADEVGLGKTIQAGLIASELIARGAIDRLLLLTPAGLREQWSRELAERFAIDVPGVDGRALRRLAATLPVGVNPWSTLAAAIASIDYVKRPEVLPAASSCRWDLIVVDEAHGVAGDSDRQQAVERLAARAAYVLLLTATPHSGDRRSFSSLCALGAAGDDGLLVFRRTRADVGITASRRVHAVRVRPSADERRMHALLDRYGEAVRAEHARRDSWLALSVLHKRAFSSAWSLAQSVDRRCDALTTSADADEAEQLALPIGDPRGELVVADEPPAWPAGISLADPARERRMLTALASAARRAAPRERKLLALARLLRRANQSAVVFTEYRDTLLHLYRSLGRPALVLHGGLAREQRDEVLTAFARGTRSILLATDAAAEGLNLHHACRLVINLELPWNPMRLEQRIGRVDRIGQRRRVHAFHLVAADTGEARILARLKARIALAKTEIGAPDPLGADEERANARLAIAGGSDDDEDSDAESGSGD
jgi:superfamily II DNA or RNA helicase